MRDFETHLNDEELLLAIDGELPGSRVKKVEEHLAACWDCRARRQRLEATISDLVEARHAEMDVQVPPDAGRRALLKANLAQIADEPLSSDHACLVLTPGGASPAPTNVVGRIAAAGSERVAAAAKVMAFKSVGRTLVVALATAATVAFIVGGVERIRIQTSAVYAEGPLEPRPNLTPGAVRAVSATQVCGASIEQHSEVFVIPAAVREQVFREYGMSAAKPQNFEVDFLITPELGGSNDIQNLWPEPYRAPVWNARVKDQLEDRLHDMVCNGEIDLSTAQHDIAADWILAYKKYFHTDRPL